MKRLFRTDLARTTRRSVKLLMFQDFNVEHTLESRSMAGMLLAGPVALVGSTKPLLSWIAKTNPRANDANPFNKATLGFQEADTFLLGYWLSLEPLAPNYPNFGLVSTHQGNVAATANDDFIGVVPLYDAQDSIPGYTTYYTTGNFTPYTNTPVSFIQDATIMHVERTKGPAPVSGSLASALVHSIYEQADAMHSSMPAFGLSLAVIDIASIQQLEGSFKILDLESGASVEHMIFDLYNHDFSTGQTIGPLTGSAAFAGSFSITYVPNGDAFMGLYFQGHGIEVAVSGDLTATFDTSDGPETFTDPDFGYTGGSLTFYFSGSTDAAEPWNDVQFGWFNHVMHDDGEPGTGSSGNLHWSYNIGY